MERRNQTIHQKLSHGIARMPTFFLYFILFYFIFIYIVTFLFTLCCSNNHFSAGAPPRAYYGNVKEVATLSEAQFAAEFGVDFDALIAGERNNQIPAGGKAAIDRQTTLAAMHRFALHGLDTPIIWNPEPVNPSPRALSP